jgi:hypothetical protein
LPRPPRRHAPPWFAISFPTTHSSH